MKLLNDYFELDSRGTTVGREFRGAIATFLTMAYILATRATKVRTEKRDHRMS